MITSIYNNSTSVHANERNSLRQWRAAGDAQIGQNRKYRGRSRCAAGPSPAPRFHVTLHARTCLRVCACTRASKPAVFVGRSGFEPRPCLASDVNRRERRESCKRAAKFACAILGSLFITYINLVQLCTVART
jgi:hypothetical protein